MERAVQKTDAAPEANNIETPRTRNLKFIREKRLNYFCGGKAKSTISAIEESPRSLTTVRAVHQPQMSKTPRRCLSAPTSQAKQSISTNVSVAKGKDLVKIVEKKPERTGVRSAQTEESMREPHTRQSLLRSSFISDLDQDLLESASIPETQKLLHVMSWAQKFLNKSEDSRRSQNTSLSSQETASVKKVAIAPDIRNRKSSELHTFQNTDLHDEDTMDHRPAELNVMFAQDLTIRCGALVDSHISKVDKDPYFHFDDEELFPHKSIKPKSPDRINVTNVPKLDSYSPLHKDIRNSQVSSCFGMAAAQGSHTDPLFQMIPPQFKGRCSPDSSRSEKDIYLIKNVTDKRVCDYSEEENISENIEKYEKYDYDSDSTVTESIGNLRDNYKPRRSESHLDTERLDDLEDFYSVEERNIPLTEDDGFKTDRTFLVKKFVEYDAPKRLLLTPETDESDTNTSLSYTAHSSSNLPEDPKARSYKVCPVCSFTNYTNTSWCTDCGSILLAAQSQPCRQRTANESTLTPRDLVDEILIPTKHEKSLDQTSLIEHKDKEYKRTVGWEVNSDVSSDCEGSVFEKYLFYVNKLNVLKHEEQKQTNGCSSKMSCEAESTAEYGKPHLPAGLPQRTVIKIDDPSDSEESEVQFLGARNAVKAYPEAQETANDMNFLEDKFIGTSVKGSLGKDI
ncbi:uncharacterized protein LOC128503114 [Spea bombifrons]|uniref:uncharacterized protein LOC128503114 n=1 Tax=Spea bombifrons TaxID=233779 RepID=UPI002349998C|nr:uncharacterized protein LOC128503114 [Spea bombifrons]